MSTPCHPGSREQALALGILVSINPLNADKCLYKPENQRFGLFIEVFLLHLNAFVMGLRTF